MNGREKCTLLRQIRRDIAKANGIEYLSADCSYEGNCRGTCPKCDAEIRWLDWELNRKTEMGESITVRGISLDTFQDVLDEKLMEQAEEYFNDADEDDDEDGFLDAEDDYDEVHEAIEAEYDPWHGRTPAVGEVDVSDFLMRGTDREEDDAVIEVQRGTYAGRGMMDFTKYARE